MVDTDREGEREGVPPPPPPPPPPFEWDVVRRRRPSGRRGGTGTDGRGHFGAKIH